MGNKEKCLSKSLHSPHSPYTPTLITSPFRSPRNPKKPLFLCTIRECIKSRRHRRHRAQKPLHPESCNCTLSAPTKSLSLSLLLEQLQRPLCSIRRRIPSPAAANAAHLRRARASFSLSIHARASVHILTPSGLSVVSPLCAVCGRGKEAQQHDRDSAPFCLLDEEPRTRDARDATFIIYEEGGDAVKTNSFERRARIRGLVLISRPLFLVLFFFRLRNADDSRTLAI